MINLLIADDHQIFRQGVRRLLSDHEDLAVVAEAGNYAEVLKALHEFRGDVVIVDISMPGRHGMYLIAHIKSIHPHVRTLAPTMHAEDQYVSEALRLATDGSVSKDNAADD